MLTWAVAFGEEPRHVGALEPGEFFWEPELAPAGPVVLVISLPDQTLSTYRNGIRIGYSSISSGTKGRRTPPGVFTVLEKEVTHFSSKYNRAPMPHMQRLTWQGIALHGGDLPGYPASHGCIRLPHAFAKKLYDVTNRGTTVIIVDEKNSDPAVTPHSGLLFQSLEKEKSPGGAEAEFEWHPERSEEGPITVLASGADRMIYVYRNGVPIGRASFELAEPERRLGGHAFTMLEGVDDRESSFVPGRPARNWMAVRTGATVGLPELAQRVRVAPEFAARLYDLLVPGTTIVVTDAPALKASPDGHPVLLMEAGGR